MVEKKRIEVISGIDCPWCWLAHEEINQFGHDGYQFVWVPFILKWDVLQEGEPFSLSAHLVGIDPNDSQANDEYANSAQMKAAAHELDIPWVKRVARYNTINASVLAMYAKEQGLIEPYLTATFRQYFLADDPPKRNIADVEVLKAIAHKVGLEPKMVSEVLRDQKYIEMFNQQIEYGQKLGVRSVPTFVYQGRSFSRFIMPKHFDEAIIQFTNHLDVGS